MLRGVADTHAVIWYLFADSRLSANARTFLETAAEQGDKVGVSSITLAEIVYLVEKGRIPADAFTELKAMLDSPHSVLVDVPFDRNVAMAVLQVDRVQVPDFPDRLIAATALAYGVPLISRDSRIRTSGVTTIW